MISYSVKWNGIFFLFLWQRNELVKSDWKFRYIFVLKYSSHLPIWHSSSDSNNLKFLNTLKFHVSILFFCVILFLLLLTKLIRHSTNSECLQNWTLSFNQVNVIEVKMITPIYLLFAINVDCNMLIDVIFT